MTTIIILAIFTFILISVLIAQEVSVDKIKTGDYILWYTHKERRQSINISEKSKRYIFKLINYEILYTIKK